MAYLALGEYDALLGVHRRLVHRERRCSGEATDLHNLGVAIERSGSGQQHRAQALFDEALDLRRTAIYEAAADTTKKGSPPEQTGTRLPLVGGRRAQPNLGSEWRKAAGAIPVSSRRHPYFAHSAHDAAARRGAASARARRRGAAAAAAGVGWSSPRVDPAAAPAAAPALVQPAYSIGLPRPPPPMQPPPTRGSRV